MHAKEKSPELPANREGEDGAWVRTLALAASFKLDRIDVILSFASAHELPVACLTQHESHCQPLLHLHAEIVASRFLFLCASSILLLTCQSEHRLRRT